MIRTLRIPHTKRFLVRLRSTTAVQEVESELSNQDSDPSKSKSPIPFSKAKIGPFFQSPPLLANQFEEDATLVSALRRILPSQVMADIRPDLTRFGERTAGELRELGEQCEREPPYLQQYHPWGRRVDRLVTSPAWKKQKIVSAQEGVIAIGYKREHAQWSRIHQAVKLYLYSPSSGLFSCPLAMTDGAASICESSNDPILKKAYDHLTSRDPALFWTSGQWMTERRGGSDVANGTETVAVKQDDGSYKLYGYKWFSSATDSDITFTLARVLDKFGQQVPGSKGLSMFYLETHDPNGQLNGIEVQRLKDKLGTRQLPTAELLLDGAKALRVSEEGRGVASISRMLTLTRIHNTISSVAGMRRIINLARDYSQRRDAFGSKIKDHGLHIKHLANMEVEQRAGLLLTLELSRLQGLEDVAMATEEDKDLLRLLTPIAKLYTAKQAVAVASEGLESFGGMGYLEDTGLPGLLRDSQVLPIWEGTTNILSLDVLRSMLKSKGGVLKSFHTDIHRRCASATPVVAQSAELVKKAAREILQFAATQNATVMQLAAREFAFGLARTYMGALLVEHASWAEATAMDALVANRWCERDLVPALKAQQCRHYTKDAADLEYQLVFDRYTKPSKL